MDLRPRTSSSTSTSHAITQQQLQPPPKFSRYRSVRKAAETKAIQNAAAHSFPGSSSPTPLPSSPSSFSNTQNESIKRSMSRYRHAKPGATKGVSSVPPPPPPAVAAPLPTRPHTQGDFLEDIQEREHQGVDGVASKPRPTSVTPQEPQDTARTSYASLQPPSQSFRHEPPSGAFTDNNAENTNSSTEYLPQERNSSVSSTEEPRPRRGRRLRMNIDVKRANVRSGTSDSLNTPTTPSRLRTVVEPRMSDNEDNANNELAAHERATAWYKQSPPKQRSVKAKGSGFLSRLKALDPTSNSKLNNNYGNNVNRDRVKTLISSPQPMRPGDVRMASGHDAPISAVNAGERKVVVTCNDLSVSLPVTPSTQTQDLLYSAANCLAEHIEPHSSILLESYKQLGLERPLRKYEHVRDVMNSWDSDTQNHFIVSRLPDNREKEGLDVKSAPRKQPSESAFHLYHSQRQGKWDKRWITLRSDGQVVVAKKQGGESMNICHLSDFDIYSPTSRETTKRVKAPKKICFAVKSQQKSNMFLTTENFVHYFATNDQQLGLDWYKAVQQWRSWYLVHILGEGDDQKSTSTSTTKPPRLPKQSFGPKSRRNSDASLPTQIDTSQPFLDLDSASWNVKSSQNGSVHSPTKDPVSKPTPSRSRSTRPQQRPATSTGKPSSNPVSESDPEPFASTGLLGRTYTQRKKALDDREKDASQCPFTGHGLLGNLNSETSNCPSERSSRRNSRDYAIPPVPATVPSSPNGGGSAPFSRAKSVKQKPKPLVDLTPLYQEAPQHVRKGRGVAADPGQPLVEAATGPDLVPGAIMVPSATTWRKPVQPPPLPTSQSQSPEIPPPRPLSNGAGIRPSTSRSTSVRHPPSQSYPHPHRSRATSLNHRNYNHDPMPAPVPSLPNTATTHGDSPFAPTGLLARSASKIPNSQGGWMLDTGRGVATGDRNNFSKPMVDLSRESEFAEGSLLRGVEVGETAGGVELETRVPIPVPVIDRG
ncbi:hypothetical protein AJ79_08134 [Helicocarpus griseus UAMH5409]|uniref:PH domain-containing protein n=1 Tax=Helicocarpus griseus UAMH5409 TaxID=1447875 RepID=A0A2B7WMW6_9EURO|nr:hypothetical protein AJ79_08134 [Helicocarpus griseus UAMH5409]